MGFWAAAVIGMAAASAAASATRPVKVVITSSTSAELKFRHSTG
jgi:hypothetical protein